MWSGLYLHHGIHFRCCPSSLYTFPKGLGSGLPFERFPRLWAVLRRGFPRAHSNFLSPLRLPISPRPQSLKVISASRARTKTNHKDKPPGRLFDGCVRRLDAPRLRRLCPRRLYEPDAVSSAATPVFFTPVVDRLWFAKPAARAVCRLFLGAPFRCIALRRIASSACFRRLAFF